MKHLRSTGRGGTSLPTRLATTLSTLPFALLLTLLLAFGGAVGLPASLAHADGGSGANPMATALPASAGPGTTTTVAGSGWPASALLTVLLCGQDAIAGTDDCANPTGRAVTTGPDGRFTQRLQVVVPPKPCPCVIHVSTVMGAQESANAPFDVIGAPTAPIPQNAAGPGQLEVLRASLSGDGGLLDWFGAPPSRTLRVVVADLGGSPVSNPEFQLGTWHSVLSPDWSAAPWQGTLQPGKPQEIDLPVQFDSGASGDYFVRLTYQGRTLTTQQETLPVAWGVDVFWVLLFVVVAVGLFRIGLAVLDKVRPDVTQRARDRRRARLGRRRAGDPLPGIVIPEPGGTGPQSTEAVASPWEPRVFVTPPALPGDLAPVLPPVFPSERVNAEAETTVLPPVLPQLPPVPAYAPTVRPAAAAAPDGPTLPWFAPGTVLTKPAPTPAPTPSPQAAPTPAPRPTPQPAPPQARIPGPSTPSERPTDT